MPKAPAESAPLKLAEEFPPVSTAEWEAVIHADLKGADYEKKLVWRTEEGIAVKPYYRKEDLPAVLPTFVRNGQAWLNAQDIAPASNAIRADRHHEAGATAVQELAYAIAEAVDLLASSPDPATTASDATLVLAVGPNYFIEIAKLRAARLLWARVLEAFGVSADLAAKLKIHSITALADKSIYDPYTNLLRATTEALSAVLGGADALTVAPARFSDRLADNVQKVLAEEAHVDKVADPAGGAYYIEALTDAIARESWTLFQQVEAQGGFSKAQEMIAKQLDESRAAKEKAVASRRKVLVGVNNYPDINERALDSASELSSAGWRMATSFERIRLRTERHAAKRGKTPKVLLLKRGDLKMKMARGTFCQNFFGCAGFEIVESDALEPADLVVLCSSDPEYLGIVSEVVPQTKAPVIIAGNPKEQIEELKAAGAAGFVHVLSNAVDTLTEWQDRLGMEKA
jgi:methylmalonyl-CoA mutase